MDKLGSYISSAESLANTIGGTSGPGQLDRDNGKIVNWSFKGQLMGSEWKYIGTCGPSHWGDRHSRQTKQSWFYRAFHEGPVPETGCQKRLMNGLQREPVKGMGGFGQYDDLATQEVQNSPCRRRGEYCTSKVAKSLY